jgi:ribosomal protein S18 acetylase RimI-like enzyme
MKVHIREATMADIPTLQSFEQGLIRDERPFDPTIRPDPVHYYNLKGLIEDPETLLVVAEREGEVLSCGYATRRDPRHYLDHDAYAYFGFMYTRPDYRGLGINGQIIEVLKSWAHTRGLSEIRLTVYTENQPAIRAYEKAGFTSHLLEMRLRYKPSGEE